MKPINWKKLALLGISTGLLTTQIASAATPKSASSNPPTQTSDDDDPNDGNMGYHLMTEEELTQELSPEGIKMYNSLTPEGKALAREVASMRCNGTNKCKALNACQTEKNSCAGQGACKGQGKCAFSDKNAAVKVVYDKMNGKRSQMMQKPNK